MKSVFHFMNTRIQMLRFFYGISGAQHTTTKKVTFIPDKVCKTKFKGVEALIVYPLKTIME